MTRFYPKRSKPALSGRTVGVLLALLFVITVCCLVTKGFRDDGRACPDGTTLVKRSINLPAWTCVEDPK